MKEVQILIIHVRDQKEREAFMQKQLDALGWPYHYVLDGDVADLTPEILDRYFLNDGKPETMYGQFPRTSCAYKHLLATQYILEKGLEGALIIEDDLQFYPSFKQLFLQSMDEYSDQYAQMPFIANYEESSLLLVPRSQRKKGQILYPAQRDRYAGCYYLNKHAAEAIMGYVGQYKSDTTSDCLHNRLVQTGLVHYFWSHPCLACQCTADGSMPTLIPTKPRPWKRLKWFYKRLYKHLLYHFR